MSKMLFLSFQFDLCEPSSYCTYSAEFMGDVSEIKSFRDIMRDTASTWETQWDKWPFFCLASHYCIVRRVKIAIES